MNSDGAISKHGEKGGGGIVLRDHNNGFLAAVCHHFPNVVDPKASKILACRSGSHVAMEISATRVHVELDAQGVVNMLQQPGKNLSATCSWVQDMKSLLGTFAESRFRGFGEVLILPRIS